MRLHCIGLNHNTASIGLREKMSLNEEGVRQALISLGAESQPAAPASEALILSTCNRIELYAVSKQATPADLETFLSQACGVPPDAFSGHLYHHRDFDAARHLFEVACGLDSLVIGEPQILGQVVGALDLARSEHLAGPVLNRLFQAAIHAGKRTRTETTIARNPQSISSLAASLAERYVHPIANAQAVILGAGEMAELAVEALRKRGVHSILVINRSLQRARDLARRWNAQAATFDQLEPALATADILISSTSAPHLLISAKMVREAMQARGQRPLVLIDIAVPRDIDPNAREIEHVQLFDIDQLKNHLEHSLAERTAEIPYVQAILEEELGKFSDSTRSMTMIPIIADIHQQAESIRQTELQKTLRRLPDLTEVERERIELMTQALVKKLLDAPTHSLHAAAESPQAQEYAAVARTLFGLSPEEVPGVKAQKPEVEAE